jgi:hypothetical protein
MKKIWKDIELKVVVSSSSSMYEEPKKRIIENYHIKCRFIYDLEIRSRKYEMDKDLNEKISEDLRGTLLHDINYTVEIKESKKTIIVNDESYSIKYPQHILIHISGQNYKKFKNNYLVFQRESLIKQVI